MLTLYYTPETCALASHIALIDAGVRYDLVRVDFDRDEQRGAGYLEVNPKGRVPALVTPDGVLTETPALLVYIAQLNPRAGLAPFDSPFELARLQAFTSYLCSSLHVAHAHRMRGHRWADSAAAIEAMRRKVPETVSAHYEHIAAHAFVGPFVMGERYTVADPYLFTLARWMEADGVDVDRFPALAEHRRMMAARESARRALDEER